MNTDMHIFKENMEMLTKRYPELALLVSHTRVEHHKLFVQPGNMPNIMIDDVTYYEGQIGKFCEHEFSKFRMKNVKAAVFLGMGLGYEVMYFMSKYAPKEEHQTQAIMIIEKDIELFTAAMNVVDLKPIFLNEHVHIFVGIPTDNLYQSFLRFFKANTTELLLCGTYQPIFLYSSMKVAKQYYQQALYTFYTASFDSIMNFGSCPEDSLIGLENMLDNIRQIVDNPGINMLYNKFKDRPAVIVATGPSLKKNMDLLHGIKNKALIISCDASFKLLMKNGIKPHMVASLEREHEVEQFFGGFEPEEVEDVYMSACPVLFNHVYEAYPGPKIIVYRNFDHFKWLQMDKGILDIKLSSANMAFKIADVLGCNPIILIGQDLAYGEDGSTHATEVPFTSEGEGRFYVKGNITEKVETNSGWYNFLKAYEGDVTSYLMPTPGEFNTYGIPDEILSHMANDMPDDRLREKASGLMRKPDMPTKKVINATEGGAYIRGTEVTTFKEAIDMYLQDSFDPLEIIKENLMPFKVKEEDIDRLQTIIQRTENDLDEIILLCIHGAEKCRLYKEELKNYLQKERYEEVRTEIVSPREKIQKHYGETFQKFLMHVVQSFHLRFEMQSAMDFENRQKTLANFEEWYTFVGDMSEICYDSLKKAKERLYG